jgi:hypothetical protein
MTDQEHLERAYRRLLAWYPWGFRHEHGPEILAVLMAGAPDGQHRPGLAESADLIRSGLWIGCGPACPGRCPRCGQPSGSCTPEPPSAPST